MYPARAPADAVTAPASRGSALGMRTIAILLAALAAGCAFAPEPEPERRGMSVEDVVRLSEAGVAPRVIVARIRADGLREDVGTDRLISLHKTLAPEVLEAMVGGDEACPDCRCWDAEP